MPGRITADRTAAAPPAARRGPAAAAVGQPASVQRLADLAEQANAGRAGSRLGAALASAGGSVTPVNRTGMPDALKAGLEALSGLPLDAVRVHRGSDRPARLGAHAFAQGTDIHLAPGQERHLPHEAWHVVQQMQGRVPAQGSIGGHRLNADPALEAEADRMGSRAQRSAPAPAASTASVAPPPIGDAGVVQRSVLHLINDEGDTRFYSDLETVERGSKLTLFDTFEKARAFDEVLASQTAIIADALTTSQDRERRVPTPFGHANGSVSAKVRHQKQGPHSLSFIAFEQRLQNRLRKDQYAELRSQIITPATATAMMKEVYNLDDDDPELQRYVLDYTSLYNEFLALIDDEEADHGEQSRFHLVTRKLLQLHPYTTYPGGRSTYLGEDRHAILGPNIDTGANAKFKNRAEYQQYLQTREDMFHSSDEEEAGHAPKKAGTPFQYTDVPPRERAFSRKRRREVAEAAAAAASAASADPVAAEEERPAKVARSSEGDVSEQPPGPATANERLDGYEADDDEESQMADGLSLAPESYLGPAPGGPGHVPTGHDMDEEKSAAPVNESHDARARIMADAMARLQLILATWRARDPGRRAASFPAGYHDHVAAVNSIGPAPASVTLDIIRADVEQWISSQDARSRD